MVRPIFVIIICAVFLGLSFWFLRPNPAPMLTAGASIPGLTFEHDKKLQAETDALLSLFDKMPTVPVYLKDEPILKSGTHVEIGAAYTQCYRGDFPIIYVKKIFYQKANRKQLVNALKHELTHAWLCRRGQMSVGHGDAFRRKFAQVGGFGN